MDESIAKTLQRFNRKERYWVVRNALGEASERLSPVFCERLQAVLAPRNVHIDPGRAWWAIDYHLDWLYAALHVHIKGLALNRAVQNGAEASPSIKGQQEDIDLIVASGREVILIEAKAFGAWTNSQLMSKLRRLNAFGANEDGVVADAEAPTHTAPRLHFVVMSRGAPAKLDPELPWPKWTRRGEEPFWLELNIGADGPDLNVGRTDNGGAAAKLGDHWAVSQF